MTETPPFRVADQVFLIAYDQNTGRATVDEAMLRVALGAAVLGELFLGEHLWIGADDTVGVTSGWPPADSALAHRVWNMIRPPTRPHRLADWITFVAGDAWERVGDRLCETGLLHRRARRWPSRGAAFPPTSPESASWASWAAVHLHSRLHRPLPPRDAFVAGLAYAAGLDRRLVDACDDLHPSADQLAAAMGERPELRRLVDHASALIGRAVLSPR